VICNSLYADDAEVFIAPHKEYVQSIASIFHRFGEVIGLAPCFQKILVVPIQCHDINLDDVPPGFPVIRTSFPMKYLKASTLGLATQKIGFSTS
jgi:hypothetical protein